MPIWKYSEFQGSGTKAHCKYSYRPETWESGTVETLQVVLSLGAMGKSGALFEVELPRPLPPLRVSPWHHWIHQGQRAYGTFLQILGS